MSATLVTKPSVDKPSRSALPAGVSVPPRNVAVDAYRGLVMLLMMGEVLQFAKVARAFPGSIFWHVLAYNQTHVDWAGMSLHDTIQPGFTFLAGVALPYSIQSRVRKGQSFTKQLFHTIWRSLILIALGIFLRSTHSSRISPLKTRSRRSGSVTPSLFCSHTAKQSGNGAHWLRSSSATGSRGLFIPPPARTSITPQ